MEQAKSSKRIIFVGGPPRSGTTLVQNMLDSHPDVLGGPEFLHLPDLIDLRRKIHQSISLGYIKKICTKKEIDDYLSSIGDNFFLRLADANNCEFYSEKTPMNILVFSELTDIFPEAHFVQVVRDPRAIVSSMAQVKKRATGKGLTPPYFTANIKASISYVQRCFNAGFAAAKKEPSKIFTIAYEDLLKNPEEESKKICKFLGIEWNESMLYPGEKKHMGEQAITANSDEIWYNSNTYNSNIDTNNLEKWKNKLNVIQQLKIIMAFKDNTELLQYGYDLSLSSLSQANPLLVKFSYLLLWSNEKIYTISSKIIRKMPGISYLKKVLSAVLRFIA